MKEDDPIENDAISDSITLKSFSMDSFGTNHDDRNEENSKLDQFDDMSEFTMDQRKTKYSIRDPRDDDEDPFRNAKIDPTNKWTYFDSRVIQSQPSGWNNLENEPLAKEEILNLFPNPMLDNACGEINDTDTFDESARDFIQSQSSDSTVETNTSHQGWWNPTAPKQQKVERETELRPQPKTDSCRAALSALPEETSQDMSLDPINRPQSADVEEVAVECIALSSTKSEEDSPLDVSEPKLSARNIEQANRSTARFLNLMTYKAKQNMRPQMKRVLWSGVVACESIKDDEEEPSGTFELVKSSTNAQDHVEDTAAGVQGRQLQIAQEGGKEKSNHSDGNHPDRLLHSRQYDYRNGFTREEYHDGQSTLTAEIARRDDGDDKFMTFMGQQIISALQGTISSYTSFVEPSKATSNVVTTRRIPHVVRESNKTAIHSNSREDLSYDEETQTFERTIPQQMDKSDNPEQRSEMRHESSNWWNRLFPGKDGALIWGGQLVSPEKPRSEESTAEGSNSQCSEDSDAETGVKVPSKRRVALWPPPEQLNYRDLNEAPITTLSSPTEERGCRLIFVMVLFLFTMAVAMFLHESSALVSVPTVYPPPLDVRNRTEFPNLTDYSSQGSTGPPIQSQPATNGNLLNTSMANETIVSPSPSYVVAIHRMRARYGP